MIICLACLLLNFIGIIALNPPPPWLVDDNTTTTSVSALFLGRGAAAHARTGEHVPRGHVAADSFPRGHVDGSGVSLRGIARLLAITTSGLFAGASVVPAMELLAEVNRDLGCISAVSRRFGRARYGIARRGESR